MSLPQTTGARAAFDRKNLKQEISGLLRGFWVSEIVGDRSGAVLSELIAALDQDVAVDQRPNKFMELQDLFCIRRDLRNATRSRRHLMNRGRYQRQRRNYRLWLAFVRANADNAEINDILNSTTLELQELPLEDQIQ